LITSHQIPVETLCRAFRVGAIGALEKPYSGHDLWSASLDGLKAAYRMRVERQMLREIEQIFETLSPGERELLDLTLCGYSSRESGERLGLAIRTIERQRSRIYSKLGVKSAMEVLQLYQFQEILRDRIRYALRSPYF
jgi:two-component system response regulator DctR